MMMQSKKMAGALCFALLMTAALPGCEVATQPTSSSGSETSTSSTAALDASGTADSSAEQTTDVATTTAAIATESTTVQTELTEAPSETAATETEVTTSTDAGGSECVIRSGVWAGADCFYQFYDNENGCTMSYEDGTGVGFQYEMSADGSAVFHMGAADDSSPVTIQADGSGGLSFAWADGRSEALTYVDYYEPDSFVFYTDAQLCDLALAYYESVNGTRPSQAAADHTSWGDGLVTVQLYDLVDGHNSTAAWYTIDRLTLMGTDVNTSESIDFSTMVGL